MKIEFEIYLEQLENRDDDLDLDLDLSLDFDLDRDLDLDIDLDRENLGERERDRDDLVLKLDDDFVYDRDDQLLLELTELRR